MSSSPRTRQIVRTQVSSIEQAIRKTEAVAKANKDSPVIDVLEDAKDVLRHGPGGDL